MASVHAIVGAILSVVIGVVTLRHLSPLSRGFIAPFSVGCAKTIVENPTTGVKALDSFLCVIVPYFEASLKHPTSDLFYGYLITLFFVCSVLWYIEASRKGAHILLRVVPVYMLITQLIGVSVVLPTLWIPVYLLVNAGDISSKSALEKKAVPVPRSLATIAIQFITFTSPISMLFFQGQELKTSIMVFQFVPIIAPFLMAPFQGSSKDRREGHVTVQIVYYMTAGACFLWQMIALVMVAKDPSLPGKLFALFTSYPGESVAAHLLLVDGAVLWVGLLYFVLVEDGLKVFLATTLGSAIVGPGATAVYLAYREQRFIDARKKLV